MLIDSRLAISKPPELGAGTRTRRITTSRIGTETSTRSQVIDETPPRAVPHLPVVSAASAVASAVATGGAMADKPARTGATSPARPVAAVALTRPPHPAPLRHVAPSALSHPSHPVAPRRTLSETVRTAPPPTVAFATLTYEDNSGRHTHVVKESQLMIGRGGAGYWVDLRIDAAKDVSREHVRLRRDEATGQFFAKDLSTYGTTINGQRIASSIDASERHETGHQSRSAAAFCGTHWPR